MSVHIHPTAVVSPQARIGDEVRIGPFAVVQEDVTIGSGTEIMAHVVIDGDTVIGRDCRVFPGAVIGADPQDFAFKGQKTRVIIGDRTTLRECVTVNKASHTDTVRIGSDCLIMAYTHVAHDCVIGDHVVIANAVQLGGHVQIGDWAVLGGVSKVHQFCRVGKHAMVAADAMITKDVPPFALTSRQPVRIEGINKVGLSRRGFSQEEIRTVDAFYDIVYFSGKNMSDGLAAYEQEVTQPASDVLDIIRFIRESKRGVYR
ncbi:MAG: acyl-ACP--UDP-N-acetylglucosamine O-acyltransferase [Candidatus Kapaibacterium sp.]